MAVAVIAVGGEEELRADGPWGSDGKGSRETTQLNSSKPFPNYMGSAT